MKTKQVVKGFISTIVAFSIACPSVAFAETVESEFQEPLDSQHIEDADCIEETSESDLSLRESEDSELDDSELEDSEYTDNTIPGNIPELEEDQSSLSDGEVESALRRGEITLDNAESISTYAESFGRAASNYRMNAFSGTDRYETSYLQVKQWTSISSGTIVITNGDKFPDSLAASGLAGAFGSPVLLVPTKELNDYSRSSLQHMKNIGAAKVIIIGGTNAISENVVNQITKLGLSVEQRLAGTDRYDTQLKIYEYGKSHNFWGNQIVLIASGSDNAFCDALSASPIAYAKKAPIFLADGASKTLNDTQKSTLKAAGKFNISIVVGGPDCVSDNAVTYMQSLSNNSSRIWGPDRYSTSRNLASTAISKGWLSKERAAFAAGSAPWDSLGGAALQGHDNSVLILVGQDRPTEASNIVKGASSVRIFGGKTVVPSAVRLDIADNLGIPYAQIEGLKIYIDAGHGFNSSNNGVLDPGACSGSRREVDYTQELATNIANRLRSRGIDVYLNTQGWYKLRHPQAVALGCDMLVSIHFNSGGGTGSESYIHSYNASWKSSDLRNRAHNAMVREMGIKDRGKFQKELAVVGGILPSCLLEIGFIDRDSDMNRYNACKWSLANAIADSLIQ